MVRIHIARFYYLTLGLVLLVGGDQALAQGLSLDFSSTAGKSPGSPVPTVRTTASATGVGTDPDKALQNAYARAVESMLGQYNRQQTTVKDNKLSEELLIHSKGSLTGYEKVKSWKEDGLHYVTIRATVDQGRLVRGMLRSGIEVDGSLLQLQVDNQFNNQNPAAAKIIGRELFMYGPDRFYKAMPQSPPRVSQTAGQYSVTFDVDLEVDMTEWSRSQRELATALKRVGKSLPTIRSSAKNTNDTNGQPTPLFRQTTIGINALSLQDYRKVVEEMQEDAEKHGENWSHCLVLLSSMRSRGPNTLDLTWQPVRLSSPVKELEEILERRYEVFLIVSDEDGNPIATTSSGPLVGKDFGMYYGQEMQAGMKRVNDSKQFEEIWLGPMLFSPGRADRDFTIPPKLTVKNMTVKVNADELKQVKRATAVLAEIE